MLPSFKATIKKWDRYPTTNTRIRLFGATTTAAVLPLASPSACVCLNLVCSPNPLCSDGSGSVSQEEYKALPHAKPTDKPEEVIHNFYLAYMDSVAPSHDET